MTNIDQSEVDKFNNSAGYWWDLNGEFEPLHLMNPTRVDFIQNHTNGVANKSVLDIGCGGGILSEALANAGANVTGVDAAPQSIQVAQLHAKTENLNINYINSTIEPYAAETDEQFDVVTCLEMLEHVPDPASVITAACELVKPNGFLFASTLNRNLKSLALGVIAAEYILNIVPKGTHDYQKFIRPSELIGMIEANGFKVKVIQGIHYNPINKSFKMNSDVSVNYILCAQKI